MRECNRCGKALKYGALCHDCNIYVTSYMQGKREGFRIAREEILDMVQIELSEKIEMKIKNEAIDECIQIIENSKTLSDNTTIWTMAEKCRLQNELRKLKGGCNDNRRNRQSYTNDK